VAWVYIFINKGKLVVAITIIGLGPGSASLLTREAWDILSSSQKVYFRTLEHPCIPDLPEHIERMSFDYIYNRAESFEQVFSDIVNELLSLGENEDVVYAVPGHPFIAESSVTLLVKEAEKKNIPVRIVAGLSYVELCLTAIQVDGIEGLQLFDAIELEQQYYPSVNPDFPLLIGQVHCNLLAGELITVLTRVYPENHLVYLIHSAGNTDQVVESVLLDEIDLSKQINHLTTLYLPPITEVSSLAGLAETVAVICSPEADFVLPDEQKLVTDFSTISNKTISAIEHKDDDEICHNLGELLHQIVLHAEISSSDGGFKLSNVIAHINSKLESIHNQIWADKNN